MPRIALVRFEGNKYLECLCPDNTYNDGDVVKVKGKSSPGFISEIFMDKRDKELFTPILHKLKKNSNVIIESSNMNIIYSDAECIVNSLGTNTKYDGAICKAIRNASGSKELEDIIKNNPHPFEFETFVCDAGNLPSKKIINIVMPFKQNDPENKDLRSAFEKVIDKAIKLKAKSIAIPFIGTGANHYSKADIADALYDVKYKYQYTPNISIKIISIEYSETKTSLNTRDKEFYKLHLKKGMEHEFIDIHDISSNPGLIFKIIADMYDFNQTYEEFENVNKLFKHLYATKKPPQDDKFNWFTQDQINKIKSGARKLSKAELIKTAIGYELNFTEFIQLYNLGGFSFRQSSHNDIMLLKYIVENNGFIQGHATVRMELQKILSPGFVFEIFDEQKEYKGK